MPVAALQASLERERAVPQGLLPFSTNRERIESLVAVGVTESHIALATGVSSSTVRRWRVGDSDPKAEYAVALDDLRATVAMLLDGGLAVEGVSAWLGSRNVNLDLLRPLDLIRDDPDVVLRAARAWLVSMNGASDERNVESPRSSLVPVFGPDGQPLSPTDPGYRRVEVVFRAVSAEVLRRLEEEPELLRQLHWRDFEELVAELFRRDGFEVELTPPSADTGVDLFAARRSGVATMLYAVECKHYTKPVGPEFVRQLAWVVERHRATGGVLATTSRFTRGALEEQRRVRFRMTLADYSRLRAWLGGQSVL